MSNFKAEKKYRINVEGVWYTDYIYDNVQPYDKSVIGRIETDTHTIGNIVVDKKCTVEGFALEDGKKLFCIENVVGWEIHEEYYIICNDNDNFYIFFDDKQKVFGPFVKVELMTEYDYILLTKYIKTKDTIREVKGIYNQYGDIILPIKFDGITINDSNCTFSVTKKGKKGIYDIDGECLIKPIYDDLKLFGKNHEFVMTKINLKFGVFTSDGNEVLPVKYDYIEYLKNLDVFVVKNDGLYGLYGGDGYQILPIAFDLYQEVNHTPFIELSMNGRPIYYHVKYNKFFQKSSLKLKKYTYKYFDGKWNDLSYEY